MADEKKPSSTPDSLVRHDGYVPKPAGDRHSVQEGYKPTVSQVGTSKPPQIFPDQPPGAEPPPKKPE